MESVVEDRRAEIIRAAAQLLDRAGPEAVTTRRVAEAAGIQAPTIYRLFGNKDGLLDAVLEQAMADRVAQKSVALDDAAQAEVDPLDDLRSAWRDQVDFGLANPELFRLMSASDRVRRSPAAQIGRTQLERRIRRLAGTRRLRVSEARAADMIQAALIGAINVELATDPDARGPELAGAVFDAVLAYILTETKPPADADAVSTAVALRSQVGELAELSPSEQALMAEWLDRVIAARARPST